MSSRRLKKHSDTLKFLSKCKPSISKAIIKNADRDLIHCMCEVAINELNGNVPLTRSQKARLCKHKSALRTLVKKKTPLKNKKSLLQRGGFIGALLAPLIGGLASTILPGLFGNK